MRYSYHALSQYASRTGRKPHEVMLSLSRDLDTAKEYGLKDVLEMEFSIVRVTEGDTYYVWFDTNIKEWVCGIVAKDGMLKTVLTRILFSWVGEGRKHRNTLGKVRTMEDVENERGV